MKVWIQRIWLCIVALSFVVAVWLWLMVMAERLGWRVVTVALAGAAFTRWHSSRIEVANGN